MSTNTPKFFLLNRHMVGGYTNPLSYLGFIEAPSPEDAAKQLGTAIKPEKIYTQHRTAQFRCKDDEWLLEKSHDQCAYYLKEIPRIDESTDIEW